MTGSPLVDLGDVSVDPDKVVALEYRSSTSAGPVTYVHVEGAARPFVVAGSRTEVAAKLWRPEFVDPPGLGRVVDHVGHPTQTRA